MATAAPVIESLSDFTSEPDRFLLRIRQGEGPIYLKSEGNSELVLQDAVAYRRLLQELERLECAAAIRQGLSESAAGLGEPMDVVMADLAREFRLDQVGGK